MRPIVFSQPMLASTVLNRAAGDGIANPPTLTHLKRFHSSNRHLRVA